MAGSRGKELPSTSWDTVRSGEVSYAERRGGAGMFVGDVGPGLTMGASLKLTLRRLGSPDKHQLLRSSAMVRNVEAGFAASPVQWK